MAEVVVVFQRPILMGGGASKAELGGGAVTGGLGLVCAATRMSGGLSLYCTAVARGSKARTSRVNGVFIGVLPFRLMEGPMSRDYSRPEE